MPKAMRVAVLSDIHGNLNALEAVLEAMGDRFDAVWCLGDLVGYGPRPNECAAVIREHCSTVLAGNHDLAACGRVSAASFSEDAGRAIRWTREVLSADIEAYLTGLEPQHVDDTAALYHGSPTDAVWEYVLDPGSAERALLASPSRLTLLGHTHSPLAVRDVAGRLAGGPVNAGALVELLPDERALLNPGSVGQPRDGDARAAWLRLEIGDDGRATRATFERTRYDIARTQREIAAAGLPEHLADRLSFGM
jgi:predicted phosphodiesterase